MCDVDCVMSSVCVVWRLNFSHIVVYWSDWVIFYRREVEENMHTAEERLHLAEMRAAASREHAQAVEAAARERVGVQQI